MAYDRYSKWSRYVPLAERRAKATQHAGKSAKQGKALQPVRTDGRRIASSFWGKAWCDNLECYSDYANRLPRGRTYVRNGSVIDLRIGKGTVEALVSGSNVYTVNVQIGGLAAARWRALVAECSGRIGSLVDLLQGRFSSGVMQILARRENGLFPTPKEMRFSCSCPDIASMCKHVAAVLYGIGSRFDIDPGLFFALRQVASEDLIAAAAGAEGLAIATASAGQTLGNDDDLGSIFGIELEPEPRQRTAPTPARTRVRTRVPPHKKASEPRRSRPESDGFDEVFGPGLEVTPQMLRDFSVPESTFANWLTNGVLLRTRVRGVYRTTETTIERFRRAYARNHR